MCVIALYTDNMPKKEDLEAMETTNGDGAGIAWISGDKVKFKKGINSKEIFELIKKEHIKPPFVVHFRIASVGGVNKELCHPFPLVEGVPLNTEGEADAVLFHNGHWGDWKDICLKTIIQKHVKFPAGNWSDTRGVAWLIGHYGTGILSLIEGNNRFTILTPKGIQKWGDWKTAKGIECSNDFWDKTWTVTDNSYWSRDKSPSDLSKPRGATTVTENGKYLEGEEPLSIANDLEDEKEFQKALEYQQAIYGDDMDYTKSPDEILQEYWNDGQPDIDERELPISMVRGKGGYNNLYYPY